MLSNLDKFIITCENNIIPSHRNVYYGLTESEVKNKKVEYKIHKNYNGKAVNLSLYGLRKFIEDNNLQNIILYYCIIPISTFTINEDITFDNDKYNMISVKTPFSFTFDRVYKL